MYLILTLFLVSLFGITFMLGRKWILVKGGRVFETEPTGPEVEYIEELRAGAQEGLRKLGFVLLVVSIRLYVKMTKFLRKIWQGGAQGVKDVLAKRSTTNPLEPTEENGFLKKMGDYKKRIRRIKERVKREEGK